MKYPDTVYKTFNFEECFVFPQYDGTLLIIFAYLEIIFSAIFR